MSNEIFEIANNIKCAFEEFELVIDHIEDTLTDLKNAKNKKDLLRDFGGEEFIRRLLEIKNTIKKEILPLKKEAYPDWFVKAVEAKDEYLGRFDETRYMYPHY